MGFVGGVLLLAGVIGGVYFAFRAAKGISGKGETKALIDAQAAYARLVRESPEDPDAKITESEYVQKHMKKGPSAIGNWLLAMLFLFLLAPAGCVGMMMGAG